MSDMNKPAIHHITDTLGAEAICAALGVTPHSIRGARTTGQFPASWYDALQSMCIEVGIPCPRNAFNWKAAAKKSSRTHATVDNSEEDQDQKAGTCSKEQPTYPKGQVDAASVIGGAA